MLHSDRLAWLSSATLKNLSQVFQVGFWCRKRQIWSTHRVDWEDELKNEKDLENEDDLKTEDNLKNEDDLKNEDNLKNENDLKNKENLQKIICPTPHLKEYYLKLFDDLSPQQPLDNWY